MFIGPLVACCKILFYEKMADLPVCRSTLMPEKNIFFEPAHTFDYDWVNHILREHHRTGFPVITNRDTTLDFSSIKDQLLVRKPFLLITINIFLISSLISFKLYITLLA